MKMKLLNILFLVVVFGFSSNAQKVISFNPVASGPKCMNKGETAVFSFPNNVPISWKTTNGLKIISSGSNYIEVKRNSICGTESVCAFFRNPNKLSKLPLIFCFSLPSCSEFYCGATCGNKCPDAIRVIDLNAMGKDEVYFGVILPQEYRNDWVVYSTYWDFNGPNTVPPGETPKGPPLGAHANGPGVQVLLDGKRYGLAPNSNVVNGVYSLHVRAYVRNKFTGKVCEIEYRKSYRSPVFGTKSYAEAGGSDGSGISVGGGISGGNKEVNTPTKKSFYVKMAPNPSDRFVKLDMPRTFGQISVSVSDLNGKFISKISFKKDAPYLLETTNFVDGIYILKIQSERGDFVTKRLVVKH